MVVENYIVNYKGMVCVAVFFFFLVFYPNI